MTDYDQTKADYLKAAEWLNLTYDSFSECLEYFRQAEARIAPYDERELILEGIRAMRKEIEEMEEKVADLYRQLTGRADGQS
jgi:hypothetical protein